MIEAIELHLTGRLGSDTGAFNPLTAAPDGRGPSVSAIIPNYNHARFLDQRIQSILQQRLPVNELIILDDASTDDSLQVIERAIAGAHVPCRIIRNSKNSGSIFAQWQKGLAAASGDIVWICESDDDCEEGFLATLVPYFVDPGVMLAFGDINFIDEHGKERKDVNDYRLYSGFFDRPHIASAHAWFNGPLGTRCIITNVGGCLFRRQSLSDDIRSELVTYRTCGDWFLYSRLARGGKIAFDPKAKASFRVHGSNSSLSSFKVDGYYRECLRVLQAFRRHYGIDRPTVQTALQNTYNQCVEHLGRDAARKLVDDQAFRATMAVPRTTQHIVLSVNAGGDVGEICRRSIDLAKHGNDVSLVVPHQAVAHELRVALPGEIAIFIEGDTADRGAGFAQDVGATTQLALN
ncbi:MAG: glycosyltransferase [Hyphomicrobium sp.]|uniref:glycosyltransferase family 2 protein n=1 Tax=Hyphomicrobium sp. TaxID=82 RepID=UPI0039E3D559